MLKFHIQILFFNIIGFYLKLNKLVFFECLRSDETLAKLIAMFRFKIRFLYGDLTIILLTFAGISLFLFSPKSVDAREGMMVQIKSPKGEQIYSLSENRIVEINYKKQHSVIEINEQRVRMLRDNSPQQIAVHRGWIDSPGQWIINLPHQISITIIGGSYALDAESY